MTFALGAAVFFAIMWWAANAHAYMWRLVSSRHPAASPHSAGTKKLETIVIARHGSLGPVFKATANYRTYAGTIISVTSTGLAFSTVLPLGLLCPSFSVPFDQLELHSTSWALWDEPFALRLRDQPDYDIILSREAVQWIRSQTGQKPFGWE